MLFTVASQVCDTIFSHSLYMMDSDQRPDSNQHPLMSLSQITVRSKGILKSASFPNSQIHGQFIG